MNVVLTPLAPKGAIAYFRQKGLAKSFARQDIWQEEHGRAFTVAKAIQRDVLEDIRNAMDIDRLKVSLRSVKRPHEPT